MAIPAKSADTSDNTNSNKLIALTFDDGPSDYTNKLLDILNKYNVKATFFVIGKKIDSNQQILKQALAQGCEVLSHTWSHADLTTLPYESIKQEIQKTKDTLYKTLDVTPKMFRPPFGEVNDNVINAAKELDSAIILWTISTLDWQTQNAQSTYDSIITNVHNGAIILCHDTVESTIDAIDQAIPALIEKGYTLVTISELLGKTEPGQIYRNGLNGWTGLTHTVQAGESLWSISKLYSTTIDAIKTLNGLTRDVIFPGQVLAISLGTPIVPPTIPPNFNGTLYIIQQSDTLSSIANKFNTTIDAIKVLNKLTNDMIYVGQILAIPASESTAIVPPTIPPNFKGPIHTVISGDTLWQIAQKFTTTIEAIKTLNKLTSDTIYPGWQLAIPETSILPPVEPFDPVTGIYTVQAGDTLWHIAQRFNTTIDAIKTLNNLTSDQLAIGQKLQITQILPTLDRIEITHMPAKTEYTIGNPLDLAGLVVTAKYNTGADSQVLGYTTNPANGSLLSNTGNQVVVISYVEAGVTKSVNFTVKVNANSTIQSFSSSYTPLIKQGNGNNGYGETIVTLHFGLSDGTLVDKTVLVSNIKWGVNTVSKVTYDIAGNVVTVTITIVSTGNNINQLAISNVNTTYTVL
jgi:peptidoglycan/xylan/chitin deacetylase (PgdA/CDA1 family)/spore germination protein YaaH